MKWWPFFDFFIMADTDVSFPSTLRKLETQTLGGGVGNYHPQTKFAKVMFLYMSASHTVHRGGIPACLAGGIPA